MVFVYCAEAMSTHHKPHPASCSPLSSYTQFYVLFMLCKRCPIIVKISKQIVKIDLRRLAIDLESPLTPPNVCLHFVEFCVRGTRVNRVSLVGSICVSPIYLYVFCVSICIFIGARVCACQCRQPQPEEAHKFCNLIKLASLENCLNFLVASRFLVFPVVR